MRCHLFVVILEAHALLDRPRKPGKAHVELIRKKLADRAYTSVPEMVDVIGVVAFRLDTKLQNIFYDCSEIVTGENRIVLFVTVGIEALDQTVPSDISEIIALRIEKHALKEITGGLNVRRITRPEQRVNAVKGLFIVRTRITPERILNNSGIFDTIEFEDLKFGIFQIVEDFNMIFGEDFGGINKYFTVSGSTTCSMQYMSSSTWPMGFLAVSKKSFQISAFVL